MDSIIYIYIKNRKAYYGKDKGYNTIKINREKISKIEYRNNIINRIIELVEGKARNNIYVYKARTEITEKKTPDTYNKTPVSTGYDPALIGVIKRNERVRKEIENIKQLLKE